MKKLTSIVLALAIALTVVAPVAASAQTAGYTFSTNLTVGSRGADVVALQSFLEAKGLLTIPAGTAKGYFGGMTKKALAAYQSMKGITPAAGYFGPITRAAVMAEGAVTGGTTTPATPGCPAGALYNSMTGAACSTGSTTTMNNTGVEGSVDIRLASNPADNSNIRTQTDVPVYGLEFRARLADVAVQTLDLQFSSVAQTSPVSVENPATLINTIKVWDGTTVLATVPVSLTSFTKDQNQVYYARISGLNFVVPKDATKTLTVSVSTNSIDTDRVLTVDGYNTSSVRTVSGNGVNSFYSVDGSAYTRTHTFKKPGSSTLTLSSPATTLRSQNYRVNGNDVVSGVVLGTFNLKSETGASTLLTVNASTTASGTLPTTLYLYNGSTLLKSKSVPSTGSVAFDNLDSTAGSLVAQSDVPTTFTIKADFPANTSNATFASTTIQSVVYQTPAGNTATANGSAVTNANQYVYGKAAIVKLASAPTISVAAQSVSGVGTTTMTATFPLTIQALGGNVIMPGVNDFTVVFSDGSNNYTSTTTNSTAGRATSVVVIPQSDIADGSTANVTVAFSINGTGALTSGLYNAALTSVKWNANAGGNATTTQTYGLEDFKTSSPVQFNR